MLWTFGRGFNILPYTAESNVFESQPLKSDGEGDRAGANDILYLELRSCHCLVVQFLPLGEGREGR
jgi:hypothetical protein